MAGHEQPSLFPELEPTPTAEFDADALARHISKHASKNPYASQELRKLAIAERYAATDLEADTTEAEKHFGSAVVNATEPEIPHAVKDILDDPELTAGWEAMTAARAEREAADRTEIAQQPKLPISQQNANEKAYQEQALQRRMRS